MAQKRLSQEERRDQIITVATDLFASKGFRGTTTRSIAEAAGVSEAIIFRHFATKEDLYDAIITTSLEKRRKTWSRELAKGDASTQNLQTLLTEFGRSALRRHRNDVTFIRLMMYSALEDHKFRERFFEVRRSPFFKLIRERIEEGQAAGEFGDVDAHLTVRSFLRTLLQYSLSNFVARENPPSPDKDEAYVQNLVTVYVRGISAPVDAPRTMHA